MLYVLTMTLGLSSLSWSPTGSHTTWTTHRQNGDNLLYPSCTLGTYRRHFLHHLRYLRETGLSPVWRVTPVTQRKFWCVDELIRFWARSAQHQRSKVNELGLNMLFLPRYNAKSQEPLGGFSSNLVHGCTTRSRWTDYILRKIRPRSKVKGRL